MVADEKALAAAEILAAAGETVTARAVRERSGVRMAVATEVARTRDAAAAAQGAVPEVAAPVRGGTGCDLRCPRWAAVKSC
ncbi:hypothetical protein C5E02_12450 [Rathayibacter rathayi]|uniref:KfrA N-terminal DNA-binding domain-containing protein n=1 Tax=Rathayibacter rathayi TaxID=33887 RepID=A0ABD6W4Z6_RATRA|nr:hypothetical protein C1O28_12790 [Rathayibacter rathayi]PPF09616.1 hypothetical protein C5C04_14580 [Rathayibacter rathayi]PPF42176.1 hypothetical protein C5C08_15265 [Rathayibacter rathayi]PPG13799.1 hypothetical protein C5C11_06100 [Rathayibacter rathayi]PPG64286.1 hypothetical protein C5C16_14795 [Rathayibacter rathayi]